MTMRNSEIKDLFTKADEQTPVDKARKQKAYQAMLREMEKPRIPVISAGNILFQQFLYLDKLFWGVYMAFICVGMIVLAGLQYGGMNRNDMITVCMVGAGILSVASICVIDKLFFGKMGELRESCYFNTKQCVAAWLVLLGVVNVAVLLLITCYLNDHWNVGLLQMGLYLLTPYLLSNIIALGILSMKAGGKKSLLFGMSTALLSISYGAAGTVPAIFLTTALWVWAVAFLLAGFLFVMQIKRLLSRIENGEVLCTN